MYYRNTFQSCEFKFLIVKFKLEKTVDVTTW